MALVGLSLEEIRLLYQFQRILAVKLVAQDPLRYACQFQLFVGGYQPLPDPRLNPVSVCNQQFSACSHLFLAQIISLCTIALGFPLV